MLTKRTRDWIKSESRWDEIFGKPPVNPNTLSREDILRFIDKAEAGLSPENLTCDGEASAKHVRHTGNLLRHVLTELRPLLSTSS